MSATPFQRRPPANAATHHSDRSARLQREICARYARACRIPLVMVRDPSEPQGYRWEDGIPEPDPDDIMANDPG